MPLSMAPVAAHTALCTIWAKVLLRLLEGWWYVYRPWKVGTVPEALMWMLTNRSASTALARAARSYRSPAVSPVRVITTLKPDFSSSVFSLLEMDRVRSFS